MKFGFIGLGQMGLPMAINLAGKYDVLAYDQNAEAVATISNHRVTIVERVEQFADVDVLILCLPTVETVKQVLFATQNGLVQHLKQGALVIDTSTSQYLATIEIGKRLREMDLRFLDAPVSGMQKRAEDGTLTMMVGGDEKSLSQVQEALTTMAANIVHMGSVGSGQLTKLINQLLFDINAAGLAEILPMSTKLGLDPEKIASVINSGTGRSYASQFFIPHILQGDFSNGYPMHAAHKDLVSGAEITAHHKISTPVLAAATTTYQQALLEGHGDKDKGGMIRVHEHLLGVAFRAKSIDEDEK